MAIRILTAAECSTAIGRIAAGGKSLQARIHTVAVSTLEHARAHGDITLACRLLDALPNGVRVKSLAYWYSHFSNGKLKLSVDKKTNQWKHNPEAFKDRTDADFDIEGADATSFADLTTEKSPETLTVAALEKMLAKVANNNDFFPGTSIPKVEPLAQELAARLVAKLRSDIAEKKAA
jgi:hypothetical protein